jgi:myosin heavy subunit
LEQFCINYANEKLHNQYNQNLFKIEQKEYTAQGVKWENIAFEDNQATLDLLEKQGAGLLHIMV